MVAEIDNGSLDDPQDELLGILLKALYPNALSIAKVQRYLKEPKLVGTTGEYANFWTWHVPKASTPEQLADLLDGIATRFEDYRPFMVGQVGTYTRMGQLPVELLEKVVRATRGSITADRLYEWLGVVSDPGLRVAERDKAFVRFDLQWNTDTLKALIAHGVETCLEKGEDCTDLVDRRLFGARPRGYGQWCLEMALGAKEGKAASFYLRELFDCVLDGARADGLTVEGARAGLAADESLLNQFDEMGKRRGRPETRPERATTPESPTDTEEQRTWQARITAQTLALREGRGKPQLLHRAAEAYLGIHGDSEGKTPLEQLGNLVGGRADLSELLLVGVEGTIAREDLPGCDDVVRLFDERRVDWLVLPFVAGLHSLEQSGRLSAGDLNESQVRLAVTILYTLPREYVDPNHAGQIGDVPA